MKTSKPRFKAYQQNQLMLIPPSIEDMIPVNHPVRVVNQIINSINIDSIQKQYKGGGCSSYHPRMLLKVLVYGYLCNLHSSRKLESAVRENINFIWLAGMEQPDHNTINRFRSERLKGSIKKVFSNVVMLMVESGHVDLQSVYTDGTKIESSSNRYTFVWGKRIQASKERIATQLEELWKYTQKVAAEELKDTTPTSFTEMNPDEVRKTIDQINQALEDKPVDKKVKDKVKYAKKNWADKLEQYQKDEAILKERNSYSKTDHDATFMRMKEDHMKNGQLKPGYNTQISTQDQIITHYTIHQSATDTNTLKSHLQSFEQTYHHYPQIITADAGYGSEENYEFLEENKIEGYVKYNYFDREQRTRKEEPKAMFLSDNLYYNPQRNCFICPMGQSMEFVENTIEKTKTGYQRTISSYRAKNCKGCPMRGMCHQGQSERVIQVSHRLRTLKKKARERLLSDEGIFHRKKRPVDVEPVFGMIKQNMAFRRFLLKGLEKVNIEFGLISLAHNIKKIVALMKNNNPLNDLWSVFTQSNYKYILILRDV